MGKGTGQGLAISHSVIVDKHGGTISFESEAGKGTTFLVRLPLEPKRFGEVMKRILFVDDESMVLDGLRRMLARNAKRMGDGVRRERA